MGVEDTFCKASGLKEGKAEYHGIGGDTENRTVQVVGNHHFIHKNGVDTHAYHDEKALHPSRKQAL